MRLIDAEKLEKRMSRRLDSLQKEYGEFDSYVMGFAEGVRSVGYETVVYPAAVDTEQKIKEILSWAQGNETVDWQFMGVLKKALEELVAVARFGHPATVEDER